MIKQGAPRLFLHENVPNFPVSLVQSLLGPCDPCIGSGLFLLIHKLDVTRRHRLCPALHDAGSEDLRFSNETETPLLLGCEIRHKARSCLE